MSSEGTKVKEQNTATTLTPVGSLSSIADHDDYKKDIDDGEETTEDAKINRRKKRQEMRKARLEAEQKYLEKPVATNTPYLEATAQEEDDAVIELKEIEQFLEDVNNENIIGKISDALSQDLDNEEDDNIDTVRYKTEFLENFEDLPSLSEVSELVEEEEAVVATTVQEEEELSKTDVGSFVDPITGQKILSSSTEAESVSSLIAEEVDEEETQDEPLDNLNLEVLDKTVKIEEHEDFMDAFMAMEKEMTIKEEITEVETEEMILARQIRHITIEFLYKLFDSVVDHIELRDEKLRLAQNLSQIKLMDMLSLVVNEYSIEKYYNSDLTRKIVEHFKRNKNYRSILPLNPATEIKEYYKYLDAVCYLDNLILREKMTLSKFSECKTVTTEELAEMEAKAQKYEKQLENLIQKTVMGRRESEYLRIVTERELKGIAKKRDEISKVRLKVVQRSHTLGRLKEKTEKLETIGDGLLMSTYVSIQTDVLALEKKIEEKNNELNKIYRLCNAELHLLAHIEEKIEMFTHDLQQKTNDLNELTNEQHTLRDHLFRLKLERIKLRKDTTELSFLGGLLDKPSLLLDFDHTTDVLKTKSILINELKQTMLSLTRQIQRVEENTQRKNL